MNATVLTRSQNDATGSPRKPGSKPARLLIPCEALSVVLVCDVEEEVAG